MSQIRTYVALLRAVNVGGTGKLPMSDLRKLLEELGFQNVATYIQSGNAVFDASGTAAQIIAKLAPGLEKLVGVPVGIAVRTNEQLEAIIAGNPFAAEAEADGARVHVAFLGAKAAAGAEASLTKMVAQYPTRRDRFHLAGDTLYLHLPDGAAETKFTGKNLDRALGVIATGRNWNTVLKLRDMSAR